jgi:hypothetical protein
VATSAVFNDHWFLPIRNGTTWVDTLVCRFSPPGAVPAPRGRGSRGRAAQMLSFATRHSPTPLLLGGSSRPSSTRIVSLTGYFSPVAANKNDADGTTHSFQLTTRNIEVGPIPTRVGWIRGFYSLVDAATDNPTITAEVNPDGQGWTTLSVTTGPRWWDHGVGAGRPPAGLLGREQGREVRAVPLHLHEPRRFFAVPQARGFLPAARFLAATRSISAHTRRCWRTVSPGCAVAGSVAHWA